MAYCSSVFSLSSMLHVLRRTLVWFECVNTSFSVVLQISLCLGRTLKEREQCAGRGPRWGERLRHWESQDPADVIVGRLSTPYFLHLSSLFMPEGGAMCMKRCYPNTASPIRSLTWNQTRGDRDKLIWQVNSGDIVNHCHFGYTTLHNLTFF